jgi:3-oxoacyl-[acyl-carrier protein] reductase
MSVENTEKIALVTGGSRGIGRAICERLAVDGYTVVINFVSQQGAAEQTRMNIERDGGRAWVHRANVGNPDEVRQLFNEIKERHGRLDVLINNAGVTHSALFALTPWAKFLEIFETNLKGTILCSQAAIRLMLPKKHGVIVNISSRSGSQPQVGLTAYSASKAALTNLSRGMARELISKGIRVNAVAPAFTETEMLGEQDREALTQMGKRIPIGRIAQAAEVAAVVSALARPDFTYVVGQCIELDGGGSL